MENKLTVRGLRISFRTTNGKVQAVRGIDFDLAKGETLAIVGESGSGKSVTSKAILGILAANAIVEGGEIIYDGKDLLKINEEDFHKIRGDKIAMIFQDPMSSLNPIVKIGRQLTEAMILKGKARQRESKQNFNTYLKLLNDNMVKAIAKGDSAKAAELKTKCKNFDKFEYKHIDLEKPYNIAYESAVEAIEDIKVLAFEMEKDAAKDVVYRTKNVAKLAKAAIHEYVVKDKAARINELSGVITSAVGAAKRSHDYSRIIPALNEIQSILEEAVAFDAPNFFSMGYYLTFSDKPLPDMPVSELNAFLRKYLDDEFMLAFIADAKQALIYSADKSAAAKQEAIKVLRANRAVFEKESLKKSEAYAAHKAMSAAVNKTIDKLELVKDSLAYTFEPGVGGEIDLYFSAIGKNKKVIKEHDKRQARHDRLTARGKEPDWKVPEAAVTDLEQVKANICRQIDRLVEHFEDALLKRGNRDFDAATVDVIDYLKANASGTVAKVTKSLARTRAIKLMDEVGIAEPRRRFNQYPFEFSGGMRQRIVIAIALAADPDILICDEPTTALDVTIQSQILELINKLKSERQLSVIFITHDLGVVANMADRVAVMYAGKIVETGTAEEVFYDAAHPYTWALLSSMPDLDTNERLEAIPGTPPNMIYPPVGDAFAARNKYAMQIDFERQPPMFQISDTHFAATWLLHPDAPKVEKPKIITERIARMKLKRGDKDAE